MKNKTACFTGHRDLHTYPACEVEKRLETELVDLIKKGYCNFEAGGALGFDTIAAQTILRFKEKYPHIKLILVLPCTEQAKSWDKVDQAIYEDIKNQADQIIYISRNYFRGCMQKRNRYLVDNSSVCICYLLETAGGTAYTVHYAYLKGLNVVNIAEKIDISGKRL